MTVQRFYRLTLYIPLVVPAIVAFAIHGAGLRPVFPFDKVAQLLLASLLYGGLPYGVVAVCGAVWIGRRPENAIRRQALRAPLWTVAAYVPLPGLILLRSGDVTMSVGVFVLGALAILALGYTYVLVVFGMRHLLSGALR